MAISHKRLYEIMDHKVALLLSTGNHEEAVRLGRKSIETAERAFGPGDREVLRALLKMGDVYRELGHLDDAKIEFERAVKMARQASPDDHEMIARLFTRLAALHEIRGERNFAIYYYEQAMKDLEAGEALNTNFAAGVLAGIAQYYRRINEDKRAEEAYRKALEVFEHLDMTLFQTRERKANILFALGELCMAHHNYPDAERSLYEALALRRQIYGDQHLEIAKTLANLASVCNAVDARADAALYYQHAMDVYEHHLETELEPYTLVAQSLCNLLRKERRGGQARLVRRRLSAARALSRTLQKRARKLNRRKGRGRGQPAPTRQTAGAF
jgi:tetratricopeptide (TPR) repeat protein